MKVNPIYRLSVEVEPDANGNARNVTVEPPYTIEFTVSRNSLASPNCCSIRIFNLAEHTRNLIYKDWFQTDKFRLIQLRAGYETFMPLIFAGSVGSASSFRSGHDIVTQIECLDGGFQMVNGFISMTRTAGEALSTVMRTLSMNLPQISGTPIIGSFPTTNSRGEVLSGNTWGLIFDRSGGLANIDNNQVKILGENEVLIGEIPLISSASGLLESPRRSSGTNLLEINLLFEPRLTVGQVVQLDSSTNARFNGTYKVMGFDHQCTISPTTAGTRRTRAFLFRGKSDFAKVAGALNQ